MDDLQGLTDEELDDRNRRLRDDCDDLRKAFNKARVAYDNICDDLAEVSREKRRRNWARNQARITEGGS